MESKVLVCACAAAALLAGALTFSMSAGRGEPGVSQRQLDELKAEVASIARRVEALAPREEASAEPAAARADDLERLRADVRALEHRLDGVARAPADTSGATPARSGPGESARSEAQLADRLDALLQVEAEGVEARRFAAALAPKLRAALPYGASLREIRCRPSLCRVEMSYPDLDAYQQFVEAHLNGRDTGAWPGPAFLVTEPELERGDVLALAYLARDEHVFDPQ